jgi:hypothetical protein
MGKGSAVQLIAFYMLGTCQGAGDTGELTAKMFCRDTLAQANLANLENKFLEFKLP